MIIIMMEIIMMGMIIIIMMTLTLIMTLMIKGIRSNRWDEHDDQDSCRWECDNCDDLTDLEQ